MRKRRWMAVLLAGVLAAGSVVPVYADETAEMVSNADQPGVDTHTAEEIMEYLNARADDVYGSGYTGEAYAQEPVTTAPYSPGALSGEYQQSALTLLNAYRYIAGVPADVELNADYSARMQAGALVNYVNGEMAHEPVKPADMDDALYQLGYSGTSQGNLALGTGINGSVRLYMSDSDSGNISRVGHRRWVLNPSMGATGFGQVGIYSGMYAFDHSGNGSGYQDVVWPAQTMPVELFNVFDAWSISTGTYQSESQVEVTLVQNRTGQTWEFSASGSDGEFYVDNGGYGQVGCVIFRPDGLSYKRGDTFDVTVTGLDGGRTLAYTVLFFSAESGAGADGVVREGWVKDENGKWRFYEDGIQVLSGWVSVEEEDPYNENKVGTVWYHIGGKGEPGEMDTGWLEDESGWKHYYLDSNGRMMHDVWTTAQEQPEIGMPAGLYYLQWDGSVQMNGWAEYKTPGVWLYCRPGDGLVDINDPNCWASEKLG